MFQFYNSKPEPLLFCLPINYSKIWIKRPRYLLQSKAATFNVYYYKAWKCNRCGVYVEWKGYDPICCAL